MTKYPKCPHCGHVMNDDEILDYEGVDIFAMVEDKQEETLECIKCGNPYICRDRCFHIKDS